MQRRGRRVETLSVRIGQTRSVTYCEFVRTDKAHPLHRAYHDEEYGVPSLDERVLFERLVLEINQAGLSWETVLKKLSFSLSRSRSRRTVSCSRE